MAMTGPIETPVAFNTIYEADDLLKFLTKTQLDLDTRFDVISDMIKNVELNECGNIRFDNIRKMLENAVALCGEMALSMGKFTHHLTEKKLIKRNTSLPQMSIFDNYNRQKRDSGIASDKALSRWSFGSGMSSQSSANRLSVFDEEVSDAHILKNRVSFDIMTPSSSTDVLEEKVIADKDDTEVKEADEKLLPKNKEEMSLPTSRIDNSLPEVDANDNALPADINDNSLTDLKKVKSKVYVHLIPTDPTTDLLALRTELSNLSHPMTSPVSLEFVTSDIFIGVSSRQMSTSSDGQTSGWNGFKASNESLNYLAINNLSRFAVENSDISDDDNRSIRLISSSDSETSIIRYHLKPIKEKRCVETQTE